MPKIKTEKYYDVGCDNCAKHLSTDFGTGMFLTKGQAQVEAFNIGFVVVNGKCLCPECCTGDKSGEGKSK